MPLGSRRPRETRLERCAVTAPRRADDGHLRVRVLVEVADDAPDAPDLLELSTAASRPRRADERTTAVCVRELVEDFEDVEDARDVLEHIDERPSETAQSQQPQRAADVVAVHAVGCRSPAGRTEGRDDRCAHHVNRAALDARVEHDACGVHASSGRDARAEGARVAIMSGSEQAGDAPTVVSHRPHFSPRTSFVGCSGRLAKNWPAELAWSAPETASAKRVSCSHASRAVAHTLRHHGNLAVPKKRRKPLAVALA